MVVLSSARDSFFPVSCADSHEKKLVLFICASCPPGWAAGGGGGEQGFVLGEARGVFGILLLFADPAQS
jgi:hypothetical protein